jgi:putative ABC transport system permease protein
MHIRNYYRSAVRQIARSRFHALINVIGLSIGIAFFLQIALYCYSEWMVNRQLKNAGRQYILTSEWKDPNMGYTLATLGPLARALKENYRAGGQLLPLRRDDGHRFPCRQRFPGGAPAGR